MLPPPMTIAVCTPSAWMSATSCGDAGGDGGIDAVGLVAHQRFARQLQQDAFVGRLGQAADTRRNYTGRWSLDDVRRGANTCSGTLAD